MCTALFTVNPSSPLSTAVSLSAPPRILAVVLVTDSPLLKSVTDLERLSDHVESFRVGETSVDDAVAASGGRLHVLMGRATRLEPRRVAGPWEGSGEGGGMGDAGGVLVVRTSRGGGGAEEERGGGGEERVAYDRLCVATGAAPRPLLDHPGVVTLRDTASVERLAARLASARRVAVVGSGGVALELVGTLGGVDLFWAVRGPHVGDAFFDSDASEFLLRRLRAGGGTPGARAAKRPLLGRREVGGQLSVRSTVPNPGPCACGRAHVAGKPRIHDDDRGEEMITPATWRSSSPLLLAPTEGGPRGAAVGPRWADALASAPAAVAGSESALASDTSTSGKVDAPAPAPGHAAPGVVHRRLQLETLCEVDAVEPGPPGSGFPLRVVLRRSGPEVDNAPSASAASSLPPAPLDVDFVIAAVGVTPDISWLPDAIERCPATGAALVDDHGRTSLPGVACAGDACAVRPDAAGAHWHQMRLWTQARVLGRVAARGLAGPPHDPGLALELFAHTTAFLGLKVVLLGRYNGQGLPPDTPEDDLVSWSREGPPDGPGGSPTTFSRVLLLRGRVVGCVLLGETGLEEAMENLILDGLVVGDLFPNMLDPGQELDHVFD